MSTEQGKGKTSGNGDADRDTAAVIRAAMRGRSDAELRPEDTARIAASYRRNLDYYRQHGRECLAAGDYRQAAEKLWGAYAQSVKSIAADYGMRISFHGSIISVGDALAALSAQDDPAAGEALDEGLARARSLHQHFYENDLSDRAVIRSSARVAEAIDLMQRRFGLNGGGNGAGREGE